MARILFSLLLILLVFHEGKTQETKLNILESPNFREQVISNEIVGIHITSNGEKGIVRFSKNHVTLEVFGEELKPLFTTTKPREKKETLLGTAYTEDRIVFLTVKWPKRKIRELYVNVFDISARMLSKKMLLTSNVENPKRGILSRTNYHQNNFDQSLSGKYISFVLDDYKNENQSFTVYVMDTETLSFTWQNTMNITSEKFYDLNDILVDDVARVFLIKKTYLSGKREKKKGEPNTTFVLMKVFQEGAEEIAIEREDKFISTLSFGSQSEKLILVGFFSDRNVSNIKGVCSFSFNQASLDLISSEYEDLPLNVYQDLYGDEYGKRMEGKELGGSLMLGSNGTFYVDHVLQDNLGNVYLIAEEFYTTTNSTSTGGVNGAFITTTTLHYDDVLVIKYNNLGEMEWGRNIFKRSTAPSYNAFIKNNQLHLILNSGKKLLEKDDGRTKVSKGWFESTSLYDITFSNMGEIQYNKIQDNKGRNYYMPSSGTFSKGGFLMISRRKPENPMRGLMLLK
ncbi:MAG: hypothetical protein AAF039_01165 [Bacteroidota bacterium]